MKKIKVRGIILNKKDINNFDILVSIFTMDYGKIEAFAYGIKKSKKREIFSLNPLSVSEIILVENKGYFNISESYLIKDYENIRKNIDKLEISLYILDSINKIFYISYEKNKFYFKLLDIIEFINETEKFKKGYKYYLVLSFLRRLIIEEGIYDIDELSNKMGKDLFELFQKLSLNNENIIENFFEEIKKMVLIFENYINEYLQVKLDIRKFIMEDL